MVDQENMKMVNTLCNRRASIQACLMYLDEGGEVLVAPPVQRILDKAVAVALYEDATWDVKSMLKKRLEHLEAEIKARTK